MEERIENMFQSFGDLQMNCSKTEEIMEHLQEVDRDFNRSLLDLERNISKFQEEVKTNKSTWLEGKEFYTETCQNQNVIT